MCVEALLCEIRSHIVVKMAMIIITLMLRIYIHSMFALNEEAITYSLIVLLIAKGLKFHRSVLGSFQKDEIWLEIY